MNLMDLTKVNEKLAAAKQLLIKHNRTDLQIVAVNKYYDTYVCVDGNGKLDYYIITHQKVKRDYPVRGQFGANYHLVDNIYSDYESIELIKGRQYTSCARSDLDSYLAKGWEIEKVYD